MKSLVIITAALTVGAGVFTIAQGAVPPHASVPTHAPAHQTYAGSNLSGRARVTISQARSIALRAHSGRVTDQELEVEGGGTGLRYSFDISDHGRIYEVGVDAQTGRVLENAAEGPHPD